MLFVTGFLVLGIGHSWVYPATSITIAKFTRTAERSLANSVYLMYWDLGFLTGPLVAAVIVTDLGISFTLAISALIPLVGSVSNLAVRMKPQQHIEP